MVEAAIEAINVADVVAAVLPSYRRIICAEEVFMVTDLSVPGPPLTSVPDVEEAFEELMCLYEYDSYEPKLATPCAGCGLFTTPMIPRMRTTITTETVAMAADFIFLKLSFIEAPYRLIPAPKGRVSLQGY